MATLDQDDLDAINALLLAAVSVTVVPSSSTVASRAGTNYVLAYTDETSSVAITVLNAAGDSIDLSAKTLGVYWETEAQVVVASLTSGITVGGASNNVVTFAIPSTVTESARRLVFALRDKAAPKAVYAGGVFDVQYLPAG